jgi:hypothetical protein
MGTELTRSEAQYVEALLDWDRKRRRGDWIRCTALTLTVPGFVVGLGLIAIYGQTERRIRERGTAAAVIRKLHAEG